MNNENSQKSNFWGGFLIGAVVGGALYALLSTKEGREKAKKLLKKGEDFLSDLEEKGKDEAKRYFEEGKEKVQEKVNEIKEEVKDVVADPVLMPKKTFNSLKKRFFKKAGKKLSFF